jgi:hypothetical protein
VRLERENCKPLDQPSERQLYLALRRMKSSFASLTAPDGSYVQVAGGPGLFFVERRDSEGTRYRAAQDPPVVVFADGTTMSFSGGTVRLDRADWFLVGQVKDILAAFSNGRSFPAFLSWRQLDSDFLPCR